VRPRINRRSLATYRRLPGGGNSPRNREPFRGRYIGAGEESGTTGEKKVALHYTFRCNVCMDQLTDVLNALSHPTRRAIISRLSNGPARFLDVARPFDTALNAVTKHLKLLERAGLIERTKLGREVFISLHATPLREVAAWVHQYESFWNERLDKFEQHFRDKTKTKNNREKKR